MEKNNSVMVKAMNLIERAAFKYANGRVNSLRYEYLKNEGVEAMIRAIDTYDPSKGAALETHIYGCIHNAMTNEKDRYERHLLDIQEPTSNDEDHGLDLENLGGAIEMADGNMKTFIYKAVRQACRNTNCGKRATDEIISRNVKIVCLNIGLVDKVGEVDLKVLAKKFNLSHEYVRVLCRDAKAYIANNRNIAAQLWDFVG